MAVLEEPRVLAAAFDAFRRDAAFGAPALARLREDAFHRFTARGFPTTRDEEWRFTNVAPIARAGFQPARNGAAPSPAVPGVIDALRAAGADACYLVIANGRFVPALSSVDRLPAGVAVRSGRDAADVDRAPAGNVFVDLNTAFFHDALHIEIAPRTVVAHPIAIVTLTASDGHPIMSLPRVTIAAGDESQATLIEVFAASGPVLANAFTDVRVGAGALVDHVKIQRQDAGTYHTATMTSRLERGSTFRSHAIALGASISRNDVIAVLDGEGAECTLNGLYVAGGDSLVDNHTTIDHAKAHCPSHEVYKGILSGHARAVFNGKIIVRPDAQKTNAKQTNKALLLTDDAQVNTKPQLEIFADDVKCTHGAAIGQLDEDALFYLQARGVGAMDARNMLIHAFAGDVLNGVRVEAVRHEAMRLVDEALA